MNGTFVGGKVFSIRKEENKDNNRMRERKGRTEKEQHSEA